MEAERFAVEAVSGEEPGSVVLTLRGELDHDTADTLRAALEEGNGTAEATGPPVTGADPPDRPVRAGRIVVDCSALTFCDSSGLNVLLRARLRALESGGSVELAGLRPPVARMFEITGAMSVFRVYEDVAEARADRRVGG
ncbi:STAS domain-containing protein [Streptomyces sp. NPDC006551]|uniref:STAS domain-containing protein n=1 Tax=Streptomyces sp. NPDC006551 TaxID=3157178 RepID=UPI0033A04935